MKIDLEEVKDHNDKIVEEQLERIEIIKLEREWIDFNILKSIIMRIIGEDGIGKYISEYSINLLELLLQDEIMNGVVELGNINRSKS